MADDLSRSVPDFTPVNLVTGFLGSGKTTLLKRMLESPASADTAVLINEFGYVGLDHELLERIDEQMVLLQSGCLCCTIRGELAQAILDLHERRAKGPAIPIYRRLVIESTGLADPLPILTTITAEPVLRHHYRLGLVITTVDAVNGLSHLERQPESRKQAAVADRLVVTKTDLATRGKPGRQFGEAIAAPEPRGALAFRRARLCSVRPFSAMTCSTWRARPSRFNAGSKSRHTPSRKLDRVRTEGAKRTMIISTIMTTRMMQISIIVMIPIGMATTFAPSH